MSLADLKEKSLQLYELLNSQVGEQTSLSWWRAVSASLLSLREERVEIERILGLLPADVEDDVAGARAAKTIAPVEKFEYQVLVRDHLLLLEGELNSLGKCGWGLAAFAPAPPGSDRCHYYIFKRRVG